jgi:hypothetical protein
MTTDNFCFYLQSRLIQTSQAGGQQYSDASPLVFPEQTHEHMLRHTDFWMERLIGQTDGVTRQIWIYTEGSTSFGRKPFARETFGRLSYKETCQLLCLSLS